MAYEVREPFWQFVDHWQTLIAGLLALIAATGTIWVTMRAANREISTSLDQIRVTQRIERRRIARESYAFLAMLEAAMESAIDDVGAARSILGNQGNDGSSSTSAYAARQRVKKNAFADLRSACLRLGGQLTAPFLRLEREIDDLAAHWTEIPSAGPQGIRVASNYGVKDQLDRIAAQAAWLRDEAVKGMTRCNTVLIDRNDGDE